MSRLAVIALLVAAGCGSCAGLGGPPSQIAHHLQTLSEQGASENTAAGPLRLTKLSFNRLLVKPEAGGYVAVSTVDAEGRFSDGARLSYLGLERVGFDVDALAARPRPPLLPALTRIVEALAARERAAAAGDAAALERLVARDWSDPDLERGRLLASLRERLGSRADPPRQVLAWFVRRERGEAEVLEEYRLRGPVAPDAVPPLRQRFRLVEEDGVFRFSAGLR